MIKALDSEKKFNLDDLIQIMGKLRASDGCPWDRQQSLKSLRSFLLEETYEVLEAIDNEVPTAHQEELGDLLFQIVFQCQLTDESDWFSLADVVDGISRKIIGRHPHVFGSGSASARTVSEVATTWQQVKQTEKPSRADPASNSVLSGLPNNLPALLASHRLSERASRVGFDWDNPSQVLEKMREEIGELEEAISENTARQRAIKINWELGDLLFTIANLARHLGSCAEDLLREANQRFKARFLVVETLAKQQGLNLVDADLQTLESLWQKAKDATSQS